MGISLQRNRIWGIASYRIIEQLRLEETLEDHLSNILWEKKPGRDYLAPCPIASEKPPETEILQRALGGCFSG